MHIAIDDTYGPERVEKSRYVTGNRRSMVAVIFKDEEVKYVREQIVGCLKFISELLGHSVDEFHFTDIYNRRRGWACFHQDQNLRLFEAFAEIYRSNRWPIEIQTIDDRTLRGSALESMTGRSDGLDLSKRADLALVMLCLKIKRRYRPVEQPLCIWVDQGKGLPSQSFGKALFKDWPGKFEGKFVSSKEPLVQIADFIAFCVNRSTALGLKDGRTKIDTWFLQLIGSMGLNSPDLPAWRLPINFGVDEFDEMHRLDRVAKGIEEP